MISSSKRLDAIIASSFIVLFCSLYIYTAPPSIYDGDSGEIAAAAHLLGLPHTTGFPLYILTGKLFTLLIPWGDIAFRLNIYSAILTTGAVVLLFFLLRSLSLSIISSSITSFIFGLGRNTIWSNAGVIRVYALSLFLAILLFYLFIQWQKTSNKKFLYLYAFIFGLAIGNHLVIVVMGAPLLFMLWREFVLNRKIRSLLYAILLFFLPLLQYLYLLIAYSRNTILTLGDISSFRGFLSYITQKDYTSKIFARLSDNSLGFLNELVNLLKTEFMLVFLIAALLGFLILWHRNKVLFLFITYIGAANILIMFLYGDNNDILVLYRYLFLVYISLAIGLGFLLNYFFQRHSFPQNKIIFATLIILIILLIGFQFKASYAVNNKHDNFIVPDLAKNILITPEPNAILITTDDAITGSIWYLQSIGYRPDIIHIGYSWFFLEWYAMDIMKKHSIILSNDVFTPSYNGQTAIRTLIVNSESRKVYTTFRQWGNDYLDSNFDLVPIGLVYRVVPKRSDIKEEFIDLNQAIWDKYTLRNVKTDLYTNPWIDNLTKYYAVSLNNVGLGYLNYGFAKEAIPFFEKALDIFPNPTTEANLEKAKNIISL